MDLLDVARGPALAVSLAVFIVGTLWRLVHLWRRPPMPDRSPPRAGAPGWLAGARTAIWRGMWPRPAFSWRTRFVTVNGYAFHIGLAVVFLGYAPHIAFIHRLSGVAWPALPDGVMYVAAGVTFVSLLAALALRWADPVRRAITSPGDLITWIVVFLPMFTGMAVLSEPSAVILARDHVIYRDPLAVHLLSLELLLVWFPFGKLMHAVLFVFSRGATGVRFSHRGVTG